MAAIQKKTTRTRRSVRTKACTDKYNGADILVTYRKLFHADYLEDMLKDLAAAREKNETRHVLAYQTLLARYVLTETETETETTAPTSKLSYDELVQAAKLAIGGDDTKKE